MNKVAPIGDSSKLLSSSRGDDESLNGSDHEEEERSLGSDGEEESEAGDASLMGSESDTGLTDNQNRILYLISLYSHVAKTSDEKEEWIRKQALTVLIYEGIVLQIIDFDYAPSSMLLGLRRVYMNVSQEGKSDVDFLREEELVNGLKVSSSEYVPVTCYQISLKGEELLKKLGKQDREAIHELVFAPGTRELLKVEFNEEDGDFYLVGASGYRRRSTIMDTEDVSYVSSAYIPQCLRHGGRPTLSNAHRAHECGQGESNIRDELDEVITLNSVSIIVSEYIPFGANNMVTLNQNIGATERVKGGFFASAIDDDSQGTKLEISTGMTNLNMLDYTLAEHANVEASIYFPTSSGIVQVETFGCSVNGDGTCYYGMQIEAVMERVKDNISLDHMSRLLVDVHRDSTRIVDSLLTKHQMKLLDLVFNGYSSCRDKVNLIVANEINPHLSAEEYMDQGEYENELKQVLGDTKSAYDISEHDTLVFGANGLLVAGPNSRHYEPLLCAYLQFHSTDLFIQNFFNRLFMLQDEMRQLRSAIDNADKDPATYHKTLALHTRLTENVIFMEEILGYLREALHDMAVPPQPTAQAGKALYERLMIAEMKEQLVHRATDLVKSVQAVRKHLELISAMIENLRDQKIKSTQELVEINTKNLCNLQFHNEKTSKSTEMIQLILAGALAFDILDRLTGQWSVVNTPWLRVIVEPLMKNIATAWFFINLALFVIFAWLMARWFRKAVYNAQGTVTVRHVVNNKINLQNMKKYLRRKGKHICQEEVHEVGTNRVTTVSWVEPNKKDWGYFAPKVTLQYDINTEYLLYVGIEYNRRLAKAKLAFSADELYERVHYDLKNSGVFAIGKNKKD